MSNLLCFIGGYILAVLGAVSSDKNAVQNKIVKLNGKYYRISPINAVEEKKED